MDQKERLRLATTPCPRPANAVPEHIKDWTVEDCTACDECGCEMGETLKTQRPVKG